ncbi:MULTISPECIES: FecR family protein [unclassified Colwellia]|uniref:FecR family protein n=2 Tax=unclassified Colwellia TaxID=196834 RepID=UPI0015F3ACFD|nr:MULTISPECIES: FecR domain-containing protein [unclassified Colwellia]MBA6348245.1 FecR domain-containing protein [Colwellia sp. BRX8-9]MBA6351429.1 FecR domain-containing protein [Colwellia sp. BRX9-1]MBA6381978.1 FecR domain-containing protein [Colwellia sp. BRX10-9]MBA6392569.1 FecR domain-containing protein [Colwellia sp. BRX10-6]
MARYNNVTPRFVKYAMLASIAFILIIASNLVNNITTFTKNDNEQQFVEVSTLQTGIGQQTRFSLSDGSRVKLNTNSLIEVNFSKKMRLLTLIKGEASFDVTKDKSRPFMVMVGERSFTALGTIFNIEKKSNKNIELVVTKGRVLITESYQPIDKLVKQQTRLTTENLPGVVIASGEIATIENSAFTANKSTSFEQIQRVLAWQQGMLVFNGQPLDEALTEVSRYTTIKFEIIDSKLNQTKVSGYFKANDIDGLLESLKNNFNVQFEKVNNNIIRLSLNTEENH